MENLNIESTWDLALELAKKRWWLVVTLLVLSIPFLFLIPPIGFLLILAPCFYFYFYFKAHQQFMSYFAATHGMAYVEYGAVEDCCGRLFEIGHSRGVSNVVSGTWNNYPIRIFNYTYVIGHGKSRSHHHFTVLEISLKKIEFPFIFLKSKKMWHFLISPWEESEVALHDKNFKLSAAKGYEIEALQIFSDQLLEYLAAHAPNFSIEFAKNRINIYDDKTLSNKKDLTQLLDVGKHIIDSSGAFISRLHDDFAALHTFYQKEKI